MSIKGGFIKEMELIFYDDFDGETLDESKWKLHQTPENGTHHYANVVGKGENIWLENSNLVIQAKKYDGEDTEKYSSTSAAVCTEGKFDFKYGRVEVRAKIPTETGMWPAIWMMPANPDYSWPMLGEIDIMELISDEPNKVWSTIHSGIYTSEDHYFRAGDTLLRDHGTYFDDYHVYSFDWEPEEMRFYVDDQLVAKIDNWKNWTADMEDGQAVNIKERPFPAPFNRNFYLKLNLATGGWSQDVDETTKWGEQTRMKVDYVKVYQNK